MGLLLALGGVVTGAVALGQPDELTVLPVARVGATISAIVARAKTSFTEADALAKTKALEAGKADAEKRADDAEKRRLKDKKPPPASGPRPNDVHGGVSGPGF